MKVPFKIDLNNKVAVITGGGGVLCSVFAAALAECGAKTAILDLNPAAAEAATRKIREAGGLAAAYECDVLSRESLEAARQKINAELGVCDLLINGAGGNSPKCTTSKEYLFPEDLDDDAGTFFGLLPENIRFVFDINFTGAFLTSQVFAKDMAKKGGGTIINVSSMNAFTPLTKIPAYSAAKAAVSNFTQWLAVHFSKVGVRVNAIAPGFFVTAQNRALLFDPAGNPTPRTEKILSQTPMDRFGEPEELLGALLLLSSKEASAFINGVIIPVDGGFSAYSGV